MGASSWAQSGQKLHKEGQNEVDAAKAQKAGAATVDSGVGKIKSWVSAEMINRGSPALILTIPI